MSRHTALRRLATVGGGTVTAIALTAAAASAHHCFVPMHSLNGPQSASWDVYSAERGAAEIAGFVAECDGAVEAGYDALEAAGLPVGIKIKATKTIGDPNDTGRIPTNNGANGKGLEYFGAGSTLADDMVMTWIAAAAAYDCG
jgi:hypothetical protein